MENQRRKQRSVRRRKRRFAGNQFTAAKVDVVALDENVESTDDDFLEGPEDELRPLPSSNNTVESGDITPKARAVLTASQRKLNIDSSSSEGSSLSSGEEQEVESTGFRVIDISILSQIFQILLCPICMSKVFLTEVAGSKMGLATSLRLCCTKDQCTFSKSFHTSNKNGQAFEVNRRTVLAAREVGIGHKGLVKFSGVMNMPPPMNKNSYRDIVKSLECAAECVAERSMKNAATETKEFYDSEDDGVYDVAVSGDGTWRKRGFKSSTGIVTAISLVTGKILDTEIMSRECRTCLLNSNKEGTPEFDLWWEGHQHECQANFFGSSGKMDPAGCVAIFSRSIEKHSLRYTEFLGDGDSKAQTQLKNERVYGDREITKLECVGHIQKRMGSRLRSLKKSCGKEKLADGKSIGGKGRLTDKLIDSLQVYYGKAIRGNSHSLPEMKGAVMAIWNHIRSTDENPNHQLCPAGKDSWCGFQKDIANDTAIYQHMHPLPAAVADKLKSVFEALSNDRLLSSCLHGQTQNQNESYNALIWKRAPKVSHSSLVTVQLATFLALSHFNDGCKTVAHILEELGVEPGIHCLKAGRKEDKERIRLSVYKSTEKAKRRRRTIRNRKKGYSDQLDEEEGPQYKSGGF
eukprot:Seg357.6 transcript_id=Seg357.6/GoldUCD/mRNA.D3Y31 product="hypothetical protein" protein_id=Seg357.6/GoldUCD/D3Y31